MTSAHLPNANWKATLPILPSKTVVTIEAFEFDMSDGDVNAIVAEVTLGNTAALSIRRPIEFLGDGTAYLNDDFTSFALAVRFTDADANVIRYVLHRPDGFALNAPDYAGQTIGAAATLELWGDHTLDTITSDDYDLQLILNLLNPVGPNILAFGGPVTDTTSTIAFEEV